MQPLLCGHYPLYVNVFSNHYGLWNFRERFPFRAHRHFSPLHTTLFPPFAPKGHSILVDSMGIFDVRADPPGVTCTDEIRATTFPHNGAEITPRASLSTAKWLIDLLIATNDTCKLASLYFQEFTINCNSLLCC